MEERLIDVNLASTSFTLWLKTSDENGGMSHPWEDNTMYD
jgi:hypothetical protein